MFIVSFTGHRDCITEESELEKIVEYYSDAIWVHGGAGGFDTQVEEFAKKHNIHTQVIRPDYRSGKPKEAPLKRNKVIVDLCQVLVACYDGRKHGGTFFTINYARNKGKNILYLTALNKKLAEKK